MLTYHVIDPVIVHLGPLAIRWYGVMYLLSFLAVWWLAVRRSAAGLVATQTRQEVEDLVFYGALGVILSAIYLMWMFQRIFFGPVDDVENQHLSPLTRREILVAAPLIILMFVLGVFPNLVLGPAQPAVAQVVEMVGQVATALRP